MSVCPNHPYIRADVCIECHPPAVKPKPAKAATPPPGARRDTDRAIEMLEELQADIFMILSASQNSRFKAALATLRSKTP